NNRIEVGNVLDVGGSLPTLTACAWVKLPTTWAGAEVFLFGKLDNNEPYTGWGLMASRPEAGDKIIADLEAAYPIRADVYGTSDIRDGTWHFISAVYEVSSNGLRTKVFVDGAFEGESSYEGEHPGTVSSADLWIGQRSPDGTCLVGELDEVRVYGNALGSNDITDLYLSYFPMAPSMSDSDSGDGSIMTRTAPPSIQLLAQDSSMRKIEFPASKGTTYDVQVTDDLSGSNWTLLMTVTAETDYVSIVDTNDDSVPRFYRLQIHNAQ
ncbi:MAG TPA: hypothetical protein DCZ95_09255, partial [Verrucomicrobia bacterium]|nr:hypothetical protein [Verrucomicrobiota bacterium]